MTNKFQTFFEKPYEEIINILNKYINDNTTIIDLGCNNGNLEESIETNNFNCTIHCIDTDKKALDLLEHKTFQKNTIKTYSKDANDFLKETELSNIDTILINTTLHEINTPQYQKEYLDWFFQTINKIIKDNGKIIIGDYYYPNDVSNEEVESYMEHQKREINHADPREKFISPELLKSKAIEHNYDIIYSNDLRAVKEINRRYYSFVFQKKK